MDEQQRDGGAEAPEQDVDRLVCHFDHLDPALGFDVLHDVYRGLMAEGPLSTSDVYGGFTMVTGYEDLLEVERHGRIFSSAEGIMHPPHEGRPRGIPIEFDPPKHTSYRKVVMDALSAQRVKEAEPALRTMAEDLVREYVDGGNDDFIEVVAF